MQGIATRDMEMTANSKQDQLQYAIDHEMFEVPYETWTEEEKIANQKAKLRSYAQTNNEGSASTQPSPEKCMEEIKSVLPRKVLSPEDLVKLLNPGKRTLQEPSSMPPSADQSFREIVKEMECASLSEPMFMADVDETDLKVFYSINEKSNLSGTFSYMASIFHSLGNEVLANECATMARVRSVSAQLKLELLQLQNAKHFKWALIVSQKPKVEIRKASMTLIKQKMISLEELFRTTRALLFPKPYYCDYAFAEDIMSGSKILHENYSNIVIPQWPEWSFRACVKRWCLFPEIALSVPDWKGGDNIPYDRDYFFRMVDTVYPKSMEMLLRKSMIKRLEGNTEDDEHLAQLPPLIAKYLSAMPDLASSVPRKYKGQHKGIPKYSETHTVNGMVFEIHYPLLPSDH
jgi:hypothetical protein